MTRHVRVSGSQRVLARSVKTETQGSADTSSSDKLDYIFWVCVTPEFRHPSDTSLSRRHTSGGSDRCCRNSSSGTQPYRSRPSNSRSSSSKLCSTRSFGRLSLSWLHQFPHSISTEHQQTRSWLNQRQEQCTTHVTQSESICVSVMVVRIGGTR